MNLFENLQKMNESTNEDFVKQECEKYGITENSYGTNYKCLYLDPSDEAATEFTDKIEADGYKLIVTQDDGVKDDVSENDKTLVYGKEVGENRCIIAVSIHPSENCIIVSCGYDEEDGAAEFFENLKPMKESNRIYLSLIKLVRDGFESGKMPYESFEDLASDTHLITSNASKVQIQDLWNFYSELIKMSSKDFYETYKNDIKFSDDFINKVETDVVEENQEELKEGIFGPSKKKIEQYEKAIKDVYGAMSSSVSFKIAAAVEAIVVEMADLNDEPKAKTELLQKLKISSNELKKSPNKFIRDIIGLGEKYTPTSTSLDELTDFYADVKKIRNVEKIGLELEDYLLGKINEAILKRMNNLKNRIRKNEAINGEPEEIIEWDADVFDDQYDDGEDKTESAILKDEKDSEQVVEGIQTLTEDSDNILDLVEAKSKRFGAMVDAIGEDMPTSEVNDFLKGLTTELDMDVYEGDKPYPTDLAGYFGQPVDELDINNSDDLEMINWIDGILTQCIDEMNAFITSRIETLRGEISAIEGDIARLELVL